MENRKKVLELFEQNKVQMQNRIEEGIERYRKGWAKITIKDSNGKVVPNARIKINQKTHEFRYGANLFMIGEFETEEKNELYKKYFKECFNMATLPFYWCDNEPEKGKQRYENNGYKIYRRPPIDLCMEFCESNGIEPREHGLAYDFFFPEWLDKDDIYATKKELTRRYKEISERYADRIKTIEVINEMEWENGKEKSQFYNDPEFVEWTFKTARQFFPANRLCVNEGSQTWNDKGRPWDRYYLEIESALLKGTPIDSIGIQYHMFLKPENEYKDTRKYYDPVHLYRILDNYARFGKDIQITEITIPCYTDNPQDEEIQAQLIEYLYSIWFSHKNVSQIIYWNLVDGYAHIPEYRDPIAVKKTIGDMTIGENKFMGGLIRFDFTPKPAYFKVKELFEKRWHTEITDVTNNEGNIEYKGFFGEYEVEIEVNGKIQKQTLNLRKTGNKNFEFII